MYYNNLQYKDIYDIIEDNTKKYKDKYYIIDPVNKTNLSYEDLNLYSNQVANFFKAKNVTKDDKISIIGKNSLETVLLFISVLKYGAIVNPIHFEESDDNIYHIVKRIDPKLIFYSKELKKEILDQFSCYYFTNISREPQATDSFFDLVKDYSNEFIPSIKKSADDITEILFTSGTTEKPKGVLYKRKQLFYMVNEVIDRISLSEQDRMLEYRAYNWASVQLLSILSCIFSGATLVLAPKFSRSSFANWIKDNNITISSGVPAVLNILANEPVELHKADAPQLRFITSSAAPLSIETLKKFEQIYGIQINQMAGMTEAGWMFGNPPSRRKVGSVGPPFKYKGVSIVDEDGNECETGTQGEIVISGISMGLGYLKENGTLEEFDHDGFLTGDIGYVDEDGYVFITGRKKDLIIRGGINISPTEITNILMQHFSVEEAATLGIPDEVYGENIASFIVLKPEYENITEEGIISFCSALLPDFKIPKQVYFVHEIPKNKRGKIDNNRLMGMIEKINNEY